MATVRLEHLALADTSIGINTLAARRENIAAVAMWPDVCTVVVLATKVHGKYTD
jgi:hypothetical protein